MLTVSMATEYSKNANILVLSFLKMEHWDAWLAEDVFREMASAEKSAERESSSSTILVEKKKPKKKVRTQKKLKPKGKAAKNSNKTLNIVNLEKGEGEDDSQSSGICTPKREAPNFTAFQFERPKEGRIFIQQMLDERIPLEELLRMEMPQELKEELRDWDEKFPNLTVHGKTIGKCAELEEREQLRQIIGRRIVEMHLWPEIQTVLSTKGSKMQKRRGKTTAELLMPEVDEWIRESPKNGKKKGVVNKRKEIKLPAINK